MMVLKQYRWHVLCLMNRMREEEKARCNCKHSNYCIARMYSIEMACHQHLNEELPAGLKREITKIEAKG